MTDGNRCKALKNLGRSETGDNDVYLRCERTQGHDGEHRSRVVKPYWWA